MADPDSPLTLGLNQPAPASDVPSVADLQFQRADVPDAEAALLCAACKTEIRDSYYHVGGAVTCPSCAEAQAAQQTRPAGRAAFLRAALYGTGAAIAGAIIFALVSLTGFQFSIVAILVGIMVGKAIRYATNGRTSRAYQVLAVVLTYGGITTSYIPSMLSEAMKQTKTAQSAPQQQGPSAMSTGQTAGTLGLAVVVLIGISLVLPFLYLGASIVSGLINLLIIGIGLRQAWRITAPNDIPILGPYPVTTTAATEPA